MPPRSQRQNLTSRTTQGHDPRHGTVMRSGGRGSDLRRTGQLRVGDLQIAYSRAGRGQPLLFLHGFFGDARVWRPQMDDLSDEHDVIAWDALGCGRSSDPPESFRIDDYAGVLRGFIHALGVVRPHVVGLSFGSTLALELYRQEPSLPKSLVLAGAYAGWAGSLPADVVEQRLNQTLADLDLPAQLVVDKYNRPGLLSDTAPALVAAANAEIMSSFHPLGMKTMVRALATADLREVLPHIEVPTLLIYGARDARSPVRIGEDLNARIPGSRFVVIPEAGHVVNFDAPARFNAEVRTYLSSIAGDGTTLQAPSDP